MHEDLEKIKKYLLKNPGGKQLSIRSASTLKNERKASSKTRKPTSSFVPNLYDKYNKQDAKPSGEDHLLDDFDEVRTRRSNRSPARNQVVTMDDDLNTDLPKKL